MASAKNAANKSADTSKPSDVSQTENSVSEEQAANAAPSPKEEEVDLTRRGLEDMDPAQAFIIQQAREADLKRMGPKAFKDMLDKNEEVRQQKRDAAGDPLLVQPLARHMAGVRFGQSWSLLSSQEQEVARRDAEGAVLIVAQYLKEREAEGQQSED